MKHFYFIFFMLSTAIITAQSDVTFSVDMSGQTFTQAYVSGSFNGWCGDCNALTDMGSGIWQTTLPLDDGEYEYKFTYDNWTGQETLTQGDVCSITNYGNTNRRLEVASNDMVLPTVVFGDCASSGGTYDITFNLDMNGYTGSFTNVQINGENYNNQGFGAWCGACAPTLTDIGGGIYSVTLSLEEYAYQFKFTVDGWSDQESFTPGDAMTATDGTNTNRYLQVDQDKTVNYIWNQSSMLSVQSYDTTQKLKVYPNPTKNSWQLDSTQKIESIEIYNLLGRKVKALHPNSIQVNIDASTFSNGLYIVNIKTDNGYNTLKLIKE